MPAARVGSKEALELRTRGFKIRPGLGQLPEVVKKLSQVLLRRSHAVIAVATRDNPAATRDLLQSGNRLAKKVLPKFLHTWLVAQLLLNLKH